MKKLDALLKKVEVFEKLAVYGDRAEFLKRIAQEAVDPKVMSIIQQMDSIVRGAGITDEAITAPLGNATLFKKVDLDAIGNAVRKAMSDPNMTTITNANKVKQLMDLMSQLRIAHRTPTEAEQAMQGAPTYEFKADPIKDRIVAYPPIDKDQQEALGRVVMIKGLTFVDPKKMSDGKLGPETRKALDAFKKYLTEKAPGKTVSDKDALAIAELIEQNKAYV